MIVIDVLLEMKRVKLPVEGSPAFLNVVANEEGFRVKAGQPAEVLTVPQGHVTAEGRAVHILCGLDHDEVIVFHMFLAVLAGSRHYGLLIGIDNPHIVNHYRRAESGYPESGDNHDVVVDVNSLEFL